MGLLRAVVELQGALRNSSEQQTAYGNSKNHLEALMSFWELQGALESFQGEIGCVRKSKEVRKLKGIQDTKQSHIGDNGTEIFQRIFFLFRIHPCRPAGVIVKEKLLVLSEDYETITAILFSLDLKTLKWTRMASVKRHQHQTEKPAKPPTSLLSLGPPARGNPTMSFDEFSGHLLIIGNYELVFPISLKDGATKNNCLSHNLNVTEINCHLDFKQNSLLLI